jgi:hypothetical protein
MDMKNLFFYVSFLSIIYIYSSIVPVAYISACYFFSLLSPNTQELGFSSDNDDDDNNDRNTPAATTTTTSPTMLGLMEKAAASTEFCYQK